MKVKDAIKELQNLDQESFIALSYWDQDALIFNMDTLQKIIDKKSQDVQSNPDFINLQKF